MGSKESFLVQLESHESFCFFLPGMYWSQRETGRTRVTGLVPNDVVALVLIGPKVLRIESLHCYHLRPENASTHFFFICF